jgi:glycosyltransferase involved in cell wall biosynthesis
MPEPSLEILCHCHLRWNWVYQRPQHVLSRLARDFRVVVEEEPVEDDRPAGLDVVTVSPAITVLRPHRPRGDRTTDIGGLVERYVRRHRTAETLVRWFYSPMFAGYPGRLDDDSEVVVYDCMDELAKFKFAPPELPRLERELLDRADAVFTGGKAIWESKRAHRPDAHCFPSAVEAEHFAKALDPDTPVPADVAGLPGPVAGYYGVVDERLDYSLVAALADDPRIGSVVMVGPTAKVDPARLPRNPKIHWLGQREYAQLPGYCKAFDVCIMPWAINDATENISPTKTLEFMAAGRPIVSAPVRDVVRNHGDLVAIADTPAAFADAVAAAAARPDPRAVEAGRRRARENSWDATVDSMREILLDATERRIGCRSNAPAISSSAAGLPA